MPKFTFNCQCGHTVKKYTSRDKKEIQCDKCNKIMSREIPNLNRPADKREVINPLLNTRWPDDQKKIIKARKLKYYWSVEVPRLVNSGTYSLSTMLEKGWVWIDDNGDLHIHTKPPHER